MVHQSSERVGRFTDGQVMEEEIREGLARSLDFIQSERYARSELEGQTELLLHQSIQRLVVLARVIDDEINTSEPESEVKKQLSHLYTGGVLQLLAARRDSRIQAEQPTPVSKISLLHAQEAVSLLVMILGQMNTARKDQQDRQQKIRYPGSALSQLSEQLRQEEHILKTLESELKQRPVAFEVLHSLGLFIHRCRCLLRKKNLKVVEELLALSMQIEGAVEGVKTESKDQLRMWKYRQEEIDHQLRRLENKNKPFGLPSPGLEWISRRIRKLQDIESIQSRILAGLGVSLTISLLFFLVSTTAITLLGTFSSINKTNDNLGRLNDYILLSKEVEDLLNNNNQRLDIEADLDAIDEPIDRLVESISSLQVKLRVPQAQGDDPMAGEIQATIAEQSKALENLNEQRNMYLSQRSLKEKDYTAMISRLTTLQRDIATTKSGSAQGRKSFVSNPSPVRSAATEPSAGRSERASGSMASFAVTKEGAVDPWYVSLIDFMASPIQDQNFLKHSRRIALAAFAGALGSIMSILIRLDQVDERSIKNPFMVGALKPFIGAVFGIVIFMILSTNVIDLMPANFKLHNSPANANNTVDAGSGGLVAGQDPLGDLDSQELYKIFLVAFLAGFSERLASDTLRSVEKK